MGRLIRALSMGSRGKDLGLGASSGRSRSQPKSRPRHRRTVTTWIGVLSMQAPSHHIEFVPDLQKPGPHSAGNKGSRGRRQREGAVHVLPQRLRLDTIKVKWCSGMRWDLIVSIILLITCFITPFNLAFQIPKGGGSDRLVRSNGTSGWTTQSTWHPVRHRYLGQLQLCVPKRRVQNGRWPQSDCQVVPERMVPYRLPGYCPIWFNYPFHGLIETWRYWRGRWRFI